MQSHFSTFTNPTATASTITNCPLPKQKYHDNPRPHTEFHHDAWKLALQGHAPTSAADETPKTTQDGSKKDKKQTCFIVRHGAGYGPVDDPFGTPFR